MLDTLFIDDKNPTNNTQGWVQTGWSQWSSPDPTDNTHPIVWNRDNWAGTENIVFDIGGIPDLTLGSSESMSETPSNTPQTQSIIEWTTDNIIITDVSTNGISWDASTEHHRAESIIIEESVQVPEPIQQADTVKDDLSLIPQDRWASSRTSRIRGMLQSMIDELNWLKARQWSFVTTEQSRVDALIAEIDTLEEEYKQKIKNLKADKKQIENDISQFEHEITHIDAISEKLHAELEHCA